MMRFSVLSSSSSGNITILENDNKYYLLDAGIGIRSLYSKLSTLGIFVDAIEGIFITHEHNDHIKGLCAITSKYKCKIYMSKVTYKNLPESVKESISPINFKFFIPEEEFKVDNLTINTFRTSHDASDPVGFTFTNSDNKTLVYITDTGKLDPVPLITNKDAYIIESNHEPDLLLMSARPWILKNRIMSDYGHLSNEDSAILFSKIIGPNTKNAVLFHLSNECNTHELALSAYNIYFKKINVSLDNINLVVSNSDSPINFIEV